MKFTKSQFLNYVEGWLEAEEAKIDSLSLNNMKAALNNALVSIEDWNDGIEHYVERFSESV